MVQQQIPGARWSKYTHWFLDSWFHGITALESQSVIIILLSLTSHILSVTDIYTLRIAAATVKLRHRNQLFLQEEHTLQFPQAYMFVVGSYRMSPMSKVYNDND